MKIRLRKTLVFYLETDLTARNFPVFPEGFSLELKSNISPEEYLEVYNKVGSRWHWSERLLMSRQRLASVLSASSTMLCFLYEGGRVCGFFELSFDGEEAELVYFGLVPSYGGKGLGKLLMEAVKHTVYNRGGRRLWLHTCSFDSPAALPFYLKNGFRIYKKVTAFEKHIFE